ncbi:MAG TPA: hypothetical protein VL134_10545 [Leptolyngbya sp.]|nr:hypothetical protein [Leptolyngbya sp.]
MMTDPAKGFSSDTGASLWQEATTHVVDLLIHYGFDLGGNTARQLIEQWQAKYSTAWVRWAVIEALYQGRYKAISVEQILQLWQRRQQACYHFNYEFERLVCQNFPRNLNQSTQPKPLSLETAVLPPASTPARSTSSPSPTLPAWAAIAEPIVPEDAAEDVSAIEPIPPPAIAPSYPPGVAPLRVDQTPEILLNRVAKLQAGVETLIEQATSSLNASAEAVKTKLQPEEVEQSALNGTAADLEPSLELSDEVHPPIHQFMPTPKQSEFHSKLKAVAEKEAIDPERIDRSRA